MKTPPPGDRDRGLGAVLSDPRIWRGRCAPRNIRTLPSGLPSLDDALPGGGWPRSGLTEIIVERWGTGELRLLTPLLQLLSRQVTSAGEARGWIAWIAPPYIPYAPALAGAGIDIARVLLVHARDDGEALWAAEQALDSASCEIVLIWAERASDRQLRRLQLAAEAHDLPGILFRPPQAARAPSPAALRLKLAAGREGRLEIIKSRGGRPASLPTADLFSGLFSDLLSRGSR